METLLHAGLANAVAATALAVLAIVVERTIRRPAVSHAFWLLVLLKLLSPPLVQVPVPSSGVPGRLPTPRPESVSPASNDRVLRPAAGGGRLDPAPGGESDTPVTRSQRRGADVSWPAAVLAAWLAGSLAYWSVAGVRMVRFARLMRLASAPPPELRQRVARLAEALGIRRVPDVVLVPGTVSPLLWAPGRSARILLPAVLWNRLDEMQRDALLVHELAHLRRGDHRVRLVELAALGLYWWFPVAWMARRQLEDAEERCCDGWVARILPGSAAGYAGALVEAVAFLSPARAAVPPGASGGGQARQLKRRVTMILQGNVARPLGRRGFLVVLVCGAALLPLVPGGAEPPAEAAVVRRSAEARQDPQRPSTVEKRDRDGQVGPVAAEIKAQSKRQNERSRRSEEEDHARQVEVARDQVELLEAQLAVKREQLEAAKVAAEAAQAPLRRAAEMSKRGAMGVEELEKVKVEAAAREAEVRIRAAELREPQVRLRQARRRLAALAGSRPEGPDDARPPDQQALEKMAKALEQLRRELDALRKELRQRPDSRQERGRPGDPSVRDDGQAGAGGGSRQGDGRGRKAERDRRMIRWRILFDTRSGDEYVRQLSALGAVLAFSTEDEGPNYRVVRDLSARPAKGVEEDVTKIDRIFWVDDDPKSVESLLKALGLDAKPKHVVVFLPEKLEEKLYQDELSYQGLKEGQIAETVFKVKLIDGKYVPVVVSQRKS
jgi:beta-lactamase regulating signal transducer with metallopeptidase domain